MITSDPAQLKILFGFQPKIIGSPNAATMADFSAAVFTPIGGGQYNFYIPQFAGQYVDPQFQTRLSADAVKNFQTYFNNYKNDFQRATGYDAKVGVNNKYSDILTWMSAFPSKANLVSPGSAYENAILNPASSVENFKIAYPKATDIQAQQIVDAYAKANDKGSFWTQARDFLEGAAVVVGNYLAPGSAALTTGLTSEQAQNLLGTTAGQILTTVAGSAGGAAGNLTPEQLIGNSSIVQSIVGTVGDAVGKITSNTVVADIVTGAVKGGIVGTVTGGLAGAATNQNIGESMLTGLEYGAASGAIKGWNIGEKLSGALGQNVAQGLQAGLEEFAGQEAIGSSLRESLIAGGIKGIATGLFPSDPNAAIGQRILTDLERALASQLLSRIASKYSEPSGGGAAPSTPPGTTPTPTPSATPSGTPFGVTSAKDQQAPGSAALAQALRTGDAGAPIFGSSEDKGKAPSGWNVESLRYMG